MSDSTAEKRPVVRVPSDDCIVEGRHPHRGEWVELVGKMSVTELRQSWNGASVAKQVEALKDDEVLARREIEALKADDTMDRKIRDARLARAEKDLERSIAERVRVVDESFASMAAAVARRVVAWNWTDDRGRPLVPWNAEDEEGRPYANLDGRPETVELVELEELTYLRDLLSGEAPADRKNGAGTSPNSISATDSPATRMTPSSTTGRNRTKR
jgi:hypothetical protein